MHFQACFCNFAFSNYKKMYERTIRDLFDKWLYSREILILYGARQVGKTTLLKQMFLNRKDAVILNCELPEIFDVLQSRDKARLQFLFGNHKIVALDEAQAVPEIGRTLKIIYDELPQYKIVVTGSSSFELSSFITEALTGRNIKFRMFPLTLTEISQKYSGHQLSEKLKDILVFGNYPGLIDLGYDTKITKLNELTSDYLFKDVLIHESIKNPGILRKLLKALAFQIGSQVSTNELAGMLGIARQTIEKYIDMLEKSFIIFRLGSYSGNLRNEIKKSTKIFFYDNGIRNGIINDLSPVENRQDTGALWENFCVSEIVKQKLTSGINSEFYFWRTYDGAEIDLVEIKDGIINAHEFKWKQKRKPKIPASFNEKYKPASYRVINYQNFYELLNL